MARPKKYNLDYFPLDVNFFDDDKVILIEEDFGIKGGYVAIRLMAMVYEQGYYMEWKPTSQFTVAKRVGKGITGASLATCAWVLVSVIGLVLLRVKYAMPSNHEGLDEAMSFSTVWPNLFTFELLLVMLPSIIPFA